jgi:hypothetical protein
MIYLGSFLITCIIFATFFISVGRLYMMGKSMKIWVFTSVFDIIYGCFSGNFFRLNQTNFHADFTQRICDLLHRLLRISGIKRESGFFKFKRKLPFISLRIQTVFLEKSSSLPDFGPLAFSVLKFEVRKFIYNLIFKIFAPLNMLKVGYN